MICIKLRLFTVKMLYYYISYSIIFFKKSWINFVEQFRSSTSFGTVSILGFKVYIHILWNLCSKLGKTNGGTNSMSSFPLEGIHSWLERCIKNVRPWSFTPSYGLCFLYIIVQYQTSDVNYVSKIWKRLFQLSWFSKIEIRELSINNGHKKCFILFI